MGYEIRPLHRDFQWYINWEETQFYNRKSKTFRCMRPNLNLAENRDAGLSGYSNFTPVDLVTYIRLRNSKQFFVRSLYMDVLRGM
jgi:hypothetical protein